MPQKRISFSNFNRRLILSGGREQTGQAAMRRALGVAPEATTSVLSRWGSTLLYSGITGLQFYQWNGALYTYDGSTLYVNGSAITGLTGIYNGSRLAFNSMPPQEGLQDYLFILGGGAQPIKIDPLGNITNWGIVAPGNNAQAQNVPNEQIVIDSFNASAADWAPTHNITSITNNLTEFVTGTGSLEVNPDGFPWRTTNTSIAPLNLNNYSDGTISLLTDIFQIWIYVDDAGATALEGTWVQFDFDVNDGSFKKDYYTISIGLIPFGSTNPVVKHNVNFTVSFQQTQWQQIGWAKSQFMRVGDDLQLDWTNVRAIRISGGGLETNNIYFDNWTMSGGSAMGAGPAALAGGSEYDYYVVYQNLITGSQSNPQPVPSRVFEVAVNKVTLTQIPISPDAQVGARNLYRTQALTVPGGGIPFYLDTIYDNTTQTYLDVTSDFSVRLSTTPWQKSVAVPPNTGAPYYIDAGNGYYFKLTTNGTTGATPPTWIIPSTQWSANTQFDVGETIAPLAAAGNFYVVTTAGKSGTVSPNFGSLAATYQDGPLIGGVLWTKTGLKVTIDGSAHWTFQGINSTPVLGNLAVLNDNAPPLITYQDAIGPFEGSMLWTQDTSAGNQGNVYSSPPSRPESVGATYQMSSTNDPALKLVEWDGALWLDTVSRFFQITGNYPQFAPSTINATTGTNAPYTIVSLQLIGIVYWAPDGIRVMNWSGSRLIAFDQLAPIFRGQPEEDLPAWSSIAGPIWASESRDEIVFSDGGVLSAPNTLTLALGYDGIPQGGAIWRRPGPLMTGLAYIKQTGVVVASFNGNVYLFEQPGQLTDG